MADLDSDGLEKNRLRPGQWTVSRVAEYFHPISWIGFYHTTRSGKKGRDMGLPPYGKMPGPEVCVAISVWSQLPVFDVLDVHPGAAGSVELLTYWSLL